VLVVGISGKRAAGKDHLYGTLRAALEHQHYQDNKANSMRLRLRSSPPKIALVRVAFADQCKIGFARAAGLDAARLLSDRTYKEAHRGPMNAYYDAAVRADPAHFHKLAAEEIASAVRGCAAHDPDVGLLLVAVTDMRLPEDVVCLRACVDEINANTAAAARFLTLRLDIHDDSVRVRRGWVPNTAQDNHITETALDDFDFAVRIDTARFQGGGAMARWVRDVLLPILHDPDAKLPSTAMVDRVAVTVPSYYANTVRYFSGFPVDGGPRRILFGDVMHLFADPVACRAAVDDMSRLLIHGESTAADSNDVGNAPVTALLGISSRGYPFASMLAYKHNLKLVFGRKRGKTPGPVSEASIAQKNYGGGGVEVSRLTLGLGDVVVILDDILATGGSLLAAATAVRDTGATVSSVFAFAEYTGPFGPAAGRAGLTAQGLKVVTLLQYGPDVI
jgi:adenine phosphoribosyltransferase